MILNCKIRSSDMTATSDKCDDNIEGRNIYEIFDYNIAYIIQLQQAMEMEMEPF